MPLRFDRYDQLMGGTCPHQNAPMLGRANGKPDNLSAVGLGLLAHQAFTKPSAREAGRSPDPAVG